MTFKQGDAVMVGPFTIEQFRDTYRPGPHDDGDTAILSRHESVGALSADLALLIPHSDALPAVARWLAETPDAVAVLRAVIVAADSEREAFSADEATAMRRLYAALTGGEGAGGDA